MDQDLFALLNFRALVTQERLSIERERFKNIIFKTIVINKCACALPY